MRELCRGLTAAAAALCAMAAVSLAALLLLDAGRFAGLGPLTAAMVALAVGGTARISVVPPGGLPGAPGGTTGTTGSVPPDGLPTTNANPPGAPGGTTGTTGSVPPDGLPTTNANPPGAPGGTLDAIRPDGLPTTNANPPGAPGGTLDAIRPDGLPTTNANPPGAPGGTLDAIRPGGLPFSLHGAIHLMPLGISLVGAVVLGALLLRHGRTGLPVRAAAAAVAFPAGLAAMSLAARGNLTLPPPSGSPRCWASCWPSWRCFPGFPSNSASPWSAFRSRFSP